MSAPDLKTQPVNFIRFHGLTLLVVEHGGVEYVEIKPLSDMLGLNWRRTYETVRSDGNKELYGTVSLLPPVYDEVPTSFDLDFSALMGRKGEPAEGAKAADVHEVSTRSTRLYIRLDRSRMFLARVNTARMKVNGNVAAAKELLALQIEWAEVLHQYETHGVARKKSVKDDQAVLMQLMKTRELANSVEKPVFTAMIRQQMKEMGFSVEPDPQGSLDLTR